MHLGSWKGKVGKIINAGCLSRFLQQIQSRFQIALPLVSVSGADQGFLEREFISINVGSSTLVNVYVDLVVFTRIAGTS